MASRRMFSLEVIDSDLFLEMPLSTQALYFHLGMRADDEGFITPQKVIRLISAVGDDLKLLVAKGFAKRFDDGVLLLLHWEKNNYIRDDRKVLSQYHARIMLLPEPKTMSDKRRSDDVQMSAQCRVGKDSKKINKKETEKPAVRLGDHPNLSVVVKAFLASLGRIDGSRLHHLKYGQLLLEENTTDSVMKMIEKVSLHRGENYFPTVHSFEDLYKKQGKITDAIERIKREKAPPLEEQVGVIEVGVVYTGPGRKKERIE